MVIYYILYGDWLVLAHVACVSDLMRLSLSLSVGTSLVDGLDAAPRRWASAAFPDRNACDGVLRLWYFTFFRCGRLGGMVNGEALEPLDVRALCVVWSRNEKHSVAGLLIGGQYSGCVLLTQLLGIKCHLF